MVRSWQRGQPQSVGRRNAQPIRGFDFAAAVDLLSALNVAETLQDLSPLKSVGPHKLKGNRRANGR
jgi:proteic killer suppression protein